MTRKRKPAPLPGRWQLQDAKARFSEVVRKAKEEGPQRITVHGREEVVIVSVDEYQRLKGEEPTGRALIELMQDPRVRHLKMDRVRVPVRLRRVKL